MPDNPQTPKKPVQNPSKMPNKSATPGKEDVTGTGRSDSGQGGAPQAPRQGQKPSKT